MTFNNYILYLASIPSSDGGEKEVNKTKAKSVNAWDLF